MNRGWQLKKLLPIIAQADKRYGNTSKQQPIPRSKWDNSQHKTVRIHLQYHPCGLTSDDLHTIWNNTLGKELPKNKMQVSLSRPKNL